MTLIDAPGLIREVYLRLGAQAGLPGSDRRAFLAYASRAMRSVIVDYLRSPRPVYLTRFDTELSRVAA